MTLLTHTSGYERIHKTNTSMAASLEQIASTLEQNLIHTPEAEKALGEMVRSVKREAQELRHDHFRLVVIGLFSRGKSTFLNALMGAYVLPRKNGPCTPIVTVLRHGSTPRAEVHYQDEARPTRELTLEQFFDQYQIQESNRDDASISDTFVDVSHAVVEYPLALCRNGVELIDTPGLEHDAIRTQRTEQVMRSAHAVIYLLDATSLLQDQELRILDPFLISQGLTNIFFIVNKWDAVREGALSDQEYQRDVDEANQRIRQYLSRFCIVDGQDRSGERIFRTNSITALRQRLNNTPDTAALEQTQVPAFEASLQRFLAQDRIRVRYESVLAKLRSDRDRVLRYVNTQLTAAQMPLEELEQKVKDLQPQMEYLNGILDHVDNYLKAQTSLAHQRLMASLNEFLREIDPRIAQDVSNPRYFNLADIEKRLHPLGGVLQKVLDANPWRGEEKRIGHHLNNVLKPQLDEYVKSLVRTWCRERGVLEMQAFFNDLNEWLRREAEAFRRTVQQIDDTLGSSNPPLDPHTLLEDWTGHLPIDQDEMGEVKIDMNLLGDIAPIVAGVVVDAIGTSLLLHGVPFLGIALTVWRFSSRKKKNIAAFHQQLETAIRTGLQNAREDAIKQASRQVEPRIHAMQTGVVTAIHEQIQEIQGSLADMVAQKRDHEINIDQFKQRTQEVHEVIDQQIALIERERDNLVYAYSEQA